MRNASDLLSRAEMLTKDGYLENSVEDSLREIYEEYKDELSTKSPIYNDPQLNLAVAQSVDNVLATSSLIMTEEQKALLQADIYEVILEKKIDNKFILGAIIFAMLIKYYNCSLASDRICKGNIYPVCDEMAKRIAASIFE